MNDNFDYEEVCMGLARNKSGRDFQKIYESDYRLRNLIKKIHLEKGRILDIGCGGGSLTESVSFYYEDTEVFGCDISKNAISLAKKHGSGKVKYNLIRNQRLPYKNNFFEVCICLDVLEHVPDINLFMQEAKRVMKKNGLFYLVVPCEGQSYTLTHLFQKIKIGANLTFKNFGHIHPEFTHDYIFKLLDDYRFEIEDKKYSFHLISQIITFFQYYLPKEMLEFFLGKKKAEVYYDRNVNQSQKSKVPGLSARAGKTQEEIFIIMRKLLFKFTGFTKVIGDIENYFFRNLSFTAGKIDIIAKNIK